MKKSVEVLEDGSVSERTDRCWYIEGEKKQVTKTNKED